MKEISKEKREFIKDLQVFASNYVKEVQQVIVNHIDELYNDDAIRYLVKENKRIVDENKYFNSNSLLEAYEFEREVSTYSQPTYSDILYALCYKRYKNN